MTTRAVENEEVENWSLLHRRHPRIVGLTIVLWSARFRLCPKAHVTNLTEVLQQEIEKHVAQRRLHFSERNPQPSPRTLRRIVEDVKAGKYIETPQIREAIDTFRRAYDRHARSRLDLIEIDSTAIDRACLQRYGIDFVARDDTGKRKLKLYALHARDRATNACVAVWIFDHRPNSLDVAAFLSAIILGQAAPELGRAGKPREIRLDLGGENSEAILGPICDRLGIGLSYARAYRPHDKPGIEGLHYSLSCYVKLPANEICKKVGRGGRTLRHIRGKNFIKAYALARRDFNRSAPQRPPGAPTRAATWFGLADLFSDSRFNEKVVRADIYVDFTSRVINDRIQVGKRRFRSAKLAPHDKIRIRVYPSLVRTRLCFFGEDKTPLGEKKLEGVL
jgi:hypothetical protein